MSRPSSRRVMRVDDSVGGREGQRGDHPVGAAGGALADRQLDAHVPPVGLEDLAGYVDRAPEAVAWREARPQLAQMVLRDGDAAGVTTRAQAGLPQLVSRDPRAVQYEEGLFGHSRCNPVRFRPLPSSCDPALRLVCST
jgi:hypothetical protein